MAYTPFTKDDQPTMQAFNDAFEGAVQDSLRRGVQIETGSYVGTGTYGAANPNSLTFPFVPKMVVILGEGSLYTTIMMNGNTTATLHANMTGYHLRLSVSWSDKTVSWYTDTNSNSESTQLNASNVTYNYFAIG